MNTTQSTSAFHDRLNLAVGDTSYRQLGTLTDTHPETVRRYMQGQAPSASFMTNLCRNMGVSGEWLLSGQGPMRVRDIRTHALKNADPNELMGAVANTLTQLIERVDRLDRFVHTIETRLNASGSPMVEAKMAAQTESGSASDTMIPHTQGSHDGSAGRTDKQPTGGSGVTDQAIPGRARRIATALSERPHGDDA